MSIQDWFNGLYILLAIPSMFIYVRLALDLKSLSFTFFFMSILAFSFGVILGYSEIDSSVTREWGDFIGITFILCALFVKIRDSKPVFARFPLPLTFIPLISILFYPMISESEVIKDLLIITYQGGALVVALLLFGLNQLLYKKRLLLLVSCITLTASYIMFWFLEGEYELVFIDVSSILFAVGMVVSALGFRRTTITKIITE